MVRSFLQDDLFEYLQCPKDLGLEPPEFKEPVVGERQSSRNKERDKRSSVDVSSSKDDQSSEGESSDDGSDDSSSSSEEEIRRSIKSRGKSSKSSTKRKTPAKKTVTKKTPTSTKRKASYPSDDSSDEEVLGRFLA